jgi:hypothetical protein
MCEPNGRFSLTLYLRKLHTKDYNKKVYIYSYVQQSEL